MTSDRFTARILSDGQRLHLTDGPIDLIVGIDGSPGGTEAAHRAAIERFRGILDELDAEAALLRAPAEHGSTPLTGVVARRMWRAVRPFASQTVIAPMTALAGAVAEEILAAATAAAKLDRVYVNIGGDIALHLTNGFGFRAGLVDGVENPSVFATAEIRAGDPVRGIASCGWRSPGVSRGIADAVTVLGQTCAKADAAASVIADAVTLPADHPLVRRVPAIEADPQCDPGDPPVVQAVGPLPPEDVKAALAAGLAVAEDLARRGLIHAAALHLRGRTVYAGPIQATPIGEPIPEPKKARGGRR